MRHALRLQGCYYLIGGLWPFVHYRSFERVTGTKPDRFVTEAASALYVAIGTGILASGGSGTQAARRLAVLTAVLTTAMDIRHCPQIRAVYLTDALAEVVLSAATVTEAIVSSKRADTGPRD